MWFLKYSQDVVDCEIGVQKLCVHNWSVVNFFMWCIISILASPSVVCSLDLAELEERREHNTSASERICSHRVVCHMCIW